MKNYEPLVEAYHQANDARAISIQIGCVTIWYSYVTMVAFRVEGGRIVVLQNRWGPTTGKHLNTIDNGGRNKSRKAERVDQMRFDELWNQEVAPLLAAASDAIETAEASPVYRNARRMIDRPEQEV